MGISFNWYESGYERQITINPKGFEIVEGFVNKDIYFDRIVAKYHGSMGGVFSIVPVLIYSDNVDYSVSLDSLADSYEFQHHKNGGDNRRWCTGCSDKSIIYFN